MMFYFSDKGFSYDFCQPEYNRGPHEYPYSFDPYFLWKLPNYDEGSQLYTDRMYQQDYEKMREAVSKAGAKVASELTMGQSDIVAKHFLGPEYKCVAFATGCNVSNGYPYGILWVKK